mmetsp:Transcript_969/g.1102  ORF Transcript_969/g.1102 Transcript_969/m.1102 type:complete len:128 (-) Transcript_969:30-413(-)
MLFEAGDEDTKDNEFITDLCLDDLSKPASEKDKINASFSHLTAALPSPDNFHYQGSLTTPGYNESVQWFLYTQPIVVSKKQAETMTNFWGGDKYSQCDKGNARVCQPQGSRIVHKIKHNADPAAATM